MNARAGFSARKAALLALKVAVTALAGWLIVRKIDFAALWPLLRGASFGWLLLAIAVQYGVVTLNAMRWRVLVAAPGVPLRKYLYYAFVGSFLSLVLPSAALAEGARTYAFGRRYGGVQRNFAAALFARATGFAIQVLIVLGAVAFSRGSILAPLRGKELHLDARPLWAAAIGLALAALAAAVFFRARTREFAGMFLEYAVRGKARLGRVLALSALIQASMVLTSWALFRAVGAHPLFWQVAVIPITIQIILLLPVSFGGVGVREYLSLLFFTGLAGIPAEITLAASLLAYVYWVALAATGGAWMLYRRSLPPEEEGEAP
jgi:uncharacterized membrane protein YbhN (UPF0104 family)